MALEAVKEKDQKEAEPKSRPANSIFSIHHLIGGGLIAALILGAGLILIFLEVRYLKTQVSKFSKKLTSLEQTVRTDFDIRLLRFKIAYLEPAIDPEFAAVVAKSVARHAKAFNRDPDLVLAIIDVESKFNPKARSHAGAVGLMQILEDWKQYLGPIGNLEDPDISIRQGLQVLAFYEEMFGDLKIALTAYNRGPSAVRLALTRGLDPGNGYAEKIMQTYERLRKFNNVN